MPDVDHACLQLARRVKIHHPVVDLLRVLYGLENWRIFHTALGTVNVLYVTHVLNTLSQINSVLQGSSVQRKIRWVKK
jgi:hypothetical protein